MMEIGRGGACVPARVAPQGRIHHPFPAHNAYVFGMETPLCGRSGGHAGTAPTISFGWIVRGTVGGFEQIRVDVRPYGFVWVDCAWAFDVVWMDYTWDG